MLFHRNNSLVCSVHPISSQLIPRAVELSGIRGHVRWCGTVSVTYALACLDDVEFSQSIRALGLFI